MSQDIVERYEAVARNVERHAKKRACWPGDNDFDDAATALREAAALFTTLTAERDALAKIARDLTKGLVQLTPSGSEYFTRHGDEYFADIEACQRVVRERYDSGHKAKIELVDARRDLRTAEALVQSMREALEQLVRCEYESAEPGMCDCIDNVGKRYQSAHLAHSIVSAERALSRSEV